MKPDHERVEPGTFAMRSLFLPAAASALLALGLGMAFPCESDAGAWALIGAPAVLSQIVDSGGWDSKKPRSTDLWVDRLVVGCGGLIA